MYFIRIKDLTDLLNAKTGVIEIEGATEVITLVIRPEKKDVVLEIERKSRKHKPSAKGLTDEDVIYRDIHDNPSLPDIKRHSMCWRCAKMCIKYYQQGYRKGQSDAKKGRDKGSQ